MAGADTLSLSDYRARLERASALLTTARALPAAQRGPAVEQARDLLRPTGALFAGGETIRVDDRAVVARLGTGDDAIDRGLADLAVRIATMDRALRPGRLTAANADTALRQILRERAVAAPEPSPLDLVARWVTDRIGDLVRALASTGLNVSFVPYLVAGAGLGVALIVAALVGRGLRERLRAEAVARQQGGAAAVDPAVHLSGADDALVAGRVRDALHELYLYALAILSVRETVRFDPALTDHELLARAAGIARIGELRRLVALHERVWFGLKPVRDDDVHEARDLARRIAA